MQLGEKLVLSRAPSWVPVLSGRTVTPPGTDITSKGKQTHCHKAGALEATIDHWKAAIISTIAASLGGGLVWLVCKQEASGTAHTAVQQSSGNASFLAQRHHSQALTAPPCLAALMLPKLRLVTNPID